MSDQPPSPGPPEGWESQPPGEGSERPTEPQWPTQGPPQGPPRPANWGAIQPPPPPERPTEPQARRWETYGPPAPSGQDHSAWAQQARNERQQLPPQEPPMPPQGQGWGMQYPQQPPEQPPKPKKRRRAFMWVILAINALFLWWILATASNTADDCAYLHGQALEECQTATGIGGGLAIIFIIFLWAMVDVILGVIYIVTRRRNE
jgi:hypothetical protein